MAKVLLVIGNGFDKKLGIKSTYSEYLDSEYYMKKRAVLNTIVGEISKIINDKTYIYYKDYYREKIEVFDSLNFWDLYYGLSKELGLSNEFETWHDFEKSLYDFLCDNKKEYYSRNIIRCGDNKYNDFGRNNELDYKIVLYLYLLTSGLVSRNSIVNYYLLLEELKSFEKEFGEYIRQETDSDEYLNKSEQLINQLVGKNNELGGIDTFNYSNVLCKDNLKWHINGDVNMPIFGIDDNLCGDIKMDTFIFTKTYRRLEIYGNKKVTPRYKTHTAVIVYGHSLNEQDYSYYYPLFNELNFTNTSKASNNGKFIVFKYSKHSGKTSEETKKETITSVINLLNSYNREVLGERHFRLIDILFNQNRIRFEEVK